MELEIKKLEKAVRDLTAAIMVLTASIGAGGTNGPHKRDQKTFPTRRIHSEEETKTVCTDTNCGVINSDTITCDHTLARYQSEYNCG